MERMFHILLYRAFHAQRNYLRPCFQEIGLGAGQPKLLGYLSGEQTLEECTELLKRRSRNYAKRQLTWLKRDDSIHWIYYNSGEELPFVLQETTKYLQNHGVQ